MDVLMFLGVQPDGYVCKACRVYYDTINGELKRLGVDLLTDKCSPKGVPDLIAALDSRDIETQYSAMVGLSRITGAIAERSEKAVW